jgi:malate dehydrogenase (oxaloacetate-decarboxylating)
MFAAAADALAEASPALLDHNQPLYPGLRDARQLSRGVALAVARQAQDQGVAEAPKMDDLSHRIDRAMWAPRYSRYRRVARENTSNRN